MLKSARPAVPVIFIVVITIFNVKICILSDPGSKQLDGGMSRQILVGKTLAV